MIGEHHPSVNRAAAGLTAAARTHPGLRRSQNEDDLVCDPERGLFAVIDGIGGEQGGEVAAARTREALLSGGSAPLAEVLRSANAQIRAEIDRDPALTGMGCVATAVRIRAGRGEVAHVGDTRAWLAGADGCQQLTRDHSVAAEARELREATGADGGPAPLHAVTRDIGGVADPPADWADVLDVPLQAGDLLVLATDGLHDVAPDAEILRLLDGARRAGTSPEALVDSLIELALVRGGPDNVTVLVVRVDAAPPPPTARGEGGWTRSLPRWVLPVAALVSLLSAGLGLLVAALVFEPPKEQQAPRPVEVQMWGERDQPDLLDGRLAGRQILVPRGPLTLAEPTITRVDAGAVVDLVALRLAVRRQGAWQINIGAGASLSLVRLEAIPAQLDLTLSFEGEGGVVRLVGSELDLRALSVEGASPGRVLLQESRLSAVVLQGDQRWIGCASGAPLSWSAGERFEGVCP